MVDDSLAADLLAESCRFGLDALIEVHDAAEMARAGALGGDLIGINNRDLRTFVTNLAVTEHLAAQAPENALLVGESGIFTPADVKRVAAAGAPRHAGRRKPDAPSRRNRRHQGAPGLNTAVHLTWRLCTCQTTFDLIGFSHWREPMPADLTAKIFTDEDAARAHFESIRWANGRTCPHCGTVGNSTLLQGKSTRPGLYKCKDCRKQFTAVMGTVYEKSHIPLHKWLLATHLLCSSKKRHERAPTLSDARFRLLPHGVVYGSSHPRSDERRRRQHRLWVLTAARLKSTKPSSETFVSKRQGASGGAGHKMKVVSLVERNTGRVPARLS